MHRDLSGSSRHIRRTVLMLHKDMLTRRSLSKWHIHELKEVKAALSNCSTMNALPIEDPCLYAHWRSSNFGWHRWSMLFPALTDLNIQRSQGMKLTLLPPCTASVAGQTFSGILPSYESWTIPDRNRFFFYPYFTGMNITFCRCESTVIISKRFLVTVNIT